MRQILSKVFISMLLAAVLTGCGPKLLYQDDFSNLESGWDTHKSPTAGTVYSQGAYRITLNEVNRDQWSIAHQEFGNVAIEVDASKVDGSEDNSFGVVCKYRDLNHFYMLLISSDGAYMIQKKNEGAISRLSGEWFELSDAINKGNATNKLRAECGSDYLALYANGKLLAKVKDAEYTHGDIGFVVGSYTEPYVSIAFDNLKVFELP